MSLPRRAIVTALALACLASQAHALECDKATLPSSQVLCSDLDLKAQADERQQVWFETWRQIKEVKYR